MPGPCATPGWRSIYTGLRQTPEQIVSAALQEDADVIGLSILSGAHMHICPRSWSCCGQQGLDDVLVVVGGIIPDVRTFPKLKEIGISGIFLPGTPMQDDHRLHRSARPVADGKGVNARVTEIAERLVREEIARPKGLA